MTQVAVIGAGSWGTTVASLAAANVPSTLWARRPEIADEVNRVHANSAYLPDLRLHPDLRATASLADAAASADVLVMAVPSHGFRAVLEEAAPHIRDGTPVVSVVKGLEQGTRRRMTEIVGEVLPGHPAGVLTGPNLAKEVLAGYAAAAILAMPDEDIAERLQAVFHAELFRVYRSTDVIGAEIAGPLKNVFAIAAGMGSGLAAGDNTTAMVICRSIAEMTRLGVTIGGEQITFSGLAGMGDLIATCISPQSRNRTVGQKLAEGKSIDEIVAEMKMVAEGVKTVGVVMEIAREYEVDLPIVEEVDGVINRGRNAEDAYRGLLRRTPRTEFRDIPV